MMRSAVSCRIYEQLNAISFYIYICIYIYKMILHLIVHIFVYICILCLHASVKSEYNVVTNLCL